MQVKSTRHFLLSIFMRNCHTTHHHQPLHQITLLSLFSSSSRASSLCLRPANPNRPLSRCLPSRITADHHITKTKTKTVSMDYDKELDKTGAPAAKVHKIRITLTSRNVKPLEKCECGWRVLGGLIQCGVDAERRTGQDWSCERSLEVRGWR